jgi:hypothetical protein
MAFFHIGPSRRGVAWMRDEGQEGLGMRQAKGLTEHGVVSSRSNDPLHSALQRQSFACTAEKVLQMTHEPNSRRVVSRNQCVPCRLCWRYCCASSASTPHPPHLSLPPSNTDMPVLSWQCPGLPILVPVPSPANLPSSVSTRVNARPPEP